MVYEHYDCDDIVKYCNYSRNESFIRDSVKDKIDKDILTHAQFLFRKVIVCILYFFFDTVRERR